MPRAYTQRRLVRLTRSTRSSRRATNAQIVETPFWHEWMSAVELAFLQVSPIYWGYGIPRGNGDAVVLVPGFMGTDFYLLHLKMWLRRIGYETLHSGIAVNADCPNLLIQRNLRESIQKGYAGTGRKVHLIGHSLGGSLARSVAAQMPERVATVITLASPIQGLAARASVLHAAEIVRKQILEHHGGNVLPSCYTPACTCEFFEALHAEFPKSVRQTAIYTKLDGIVDWRMCQTGDPDVDVEVSATHIGMVMSPLVYTILAHRLAEK